MSLHLCFDVEVALIILGRMIHYRVITRYLRSRGIEVAKRGRFIRDWAEWAACLGLDILKEPGQTVPK
jgi:hypothetical protein